MKKITANCALCEEVKELKKSHIYPEFLYKPLYDRSHKFTAISTAPKKKNKKLQKGLYERLLCSRCEGLLNKYETYASGAIFNAGTEKQLRRYSDAIILENLDYLKFKLFQISLIWRAGASKREEFSNVKLGKHTEKMREMILKENPGEPYEYGCMIVTAPNTINFTHDLILAPEKIVVNEYNVYRTFITGCFWFFFISEFTKTLPYEKLFLTKDGKLPILIENSKFLEFLTKLAKDFKSKGKI